MFCVSDTPHPPMPPPRLSLKHLHCPWCDLRKFIDYYLPSQQYASCNCPKPANTRELFPATGGGPSPLSDSICAECPNFPLEPARYPPLPNRQLPPLGILPPLPHSLPFSAVPDDSPVSSHGSLPPVPDSPSPLPDSPSPLPDSPSPLPASPLSSPASPLPLPRSFPHPHSDSFPVSPRELNIDDIPRRPGPTPDPRPHSPLRRSSSADRLPPSTPRPAPLPAALEYNCSNPFCVNHRGNPRDYIVCDGCIITRPEYQWFAIQKLLGQVDSLCTEIAMRGKLSAFTAINEGVEGIAHGAHILEQDMEILAEYEERQHHAHFAHMLEVDAQDIAIAVNAAQVLGLAALPFEILHEAHELKHDKDIDRARKVTKWISTAGTGAMGGVRLGYAAADATAPVAVSYIGLGLSSVIAAKNLTFGILDLAQYQSMSGVFIILFDEMMRGIESSLREELQKRRLFDDSVPLREIWNDANFKFELINRPETRYMAPYLYFYAKYSGGLWDKILKITGTISVPLILLGSSIAAIVFTAAGALSTGGAILAGAGILATIIGVLMAARKAIKYNRSEEQFIQLLKNRSIQFTGPEFQTLSSCLSLSHRLAGKFHVGSPTRRFAHIFTVVAGCFCRCHSIVFPNRPTPDRGAPPLGGAGPASETPPSEETPLVFCCQCHRNTGTIETRAPEIRDSLDGATVGDYMRYKLAQDISDMFLTMGGNTFFTQNVSDIEEFVGLRTRAHPERKAKEGMDMTTLSMFQKFFLTRAVWEIISLDKGDRAIHHARASLEQIKSRNIRETDEQVQKRKECVKIIFDLIKKNF